MNIDSGTDTIRSFIESGVGVIELNRPERRNALHPEMYDAIPRLVERYGSNDAVGCILLTGAGTAFCAGGDVRGGGDRRHSGPPPNDRPQRRGDPLAHQARAVILLQESPKITMAALPGPAVGAGTSLALATDLRIAAESASLITGWARLAFSGDFGGTWLLTRMLGAPRALAALLDNATISSAEALALGLFNKVVPDEHCLRPRWRGRGRSSRPAHGVRLHEAERSRRGAAFPQRGPATGERAPDADPPDRGPPRGRQALAGRGRSAPQGAGYRRR